MVQKMWLEEMPREGDLTFRQLQATNNSRKSRWHGNPDPWTLADWSNAMAGEAGEACNVVKKIRRLDLGMRSHRTKETREELLKKLGHELADNLLYTFLTADAAGIDLEAAVREKFNLVSEAEGFPERL